MSDFQTPQLMKRSMVDLGDTGSLKIEGALHGVRFTISDRVNGSEIPRASVILDLEKAVWIIGGLCRLCGVKEIKPQILSAPLSLHK